MAQFYTLTEVSMMGDPWFPSEPGAKGIQSYWCKVEGEEWNVKIGKQVRDDGLPAIQVGDQIYGDLLKAVAQKSGNPYWKFKSEKVPDGVEPPKQAPRSPAQATAQASTGATQFADKWAGENVVPAWFVPVANQINDISKKVDAIYQDIGGEFTTTHKVNDAAIDPIASADPEPAPQPTAIPPEAEQENVSTIDPETEKSLKEIFGED